MAVQDFPPERGRIYYPDTDPEHAIKVVRSEAITDEGYDFLAWKKLSIIHDTLTRQLDRRVVPETIDRVALPEDPERCAKQVELLRYAAQISQPTLVDVSYPYRDAAHERNTIVGIGWAHFRDGRPRKLRESRPQSADNQVGLYGLYVMPDLQGKGMAAAMLHYFASKYPAEKPLFVGDYPEINPAMARTIQAYGFGKVGLNKGASFGGMRTPLAYYAGPTCGQMQHLLEIKHGWLRPGEFEDIGGG